MSRWDAKRLERARMPHRALVPPERITSGRGALADAYHRWSGHSEPTGRHVALDCESIDHILWNLPRDVDVTPGSEPPELEIFARAWGASRDECSLTPKEVSLRLAKSLLALLPPGWMVKRMDPGSVARADRDPYWMRRRLGASVRHYPPPVQLPEVARRSTGASQLPATDAQ